MKCWWNQREQILLDFAGEQQGPAVRVAGRQWNWRGKHRLDEKGEFVCAYRSHRVARDKLKVAAARTELWDMVPETDKRLGTVVFGTKPGFVCKNCLRLITTVVTHAEWVEHQGWRESNPSYGGYAVGYRPWYEPGAHPKSPGGKLGGQWKGRHTGEGAEFQCNYITRLRKLLRARVEDGGCARCGRMRNERGSENE